MGQYSNELMHEAGQLHAPDCRYCDDLKAAEGQRAAYDRKGLCSCNCHNRQAESCECGCCPLCPREGEPAN